VIDVEAASQADVVVNGEMMGTSDSERSLTLPTQLDYLSIEHCGVAVFQAGRDPKSSFWRSQRLQRRHEHPPLR